jgi:fucose 4-O-acetylase-like acetyltransferase
MGHLPIDTRLTFIRTLHTIIWIVMTAAICYIGYSVVVMRFGVMFSIAMALVVGEIVVILANSWTCPLTNVARRYTADTAPNFDIYLPKVIARFNKEIFSIILVLILLLYVYNAFRGEPL